MEEITQAEFNEWNHHPVTEYIDRLIREQQEIFKNQILEGMFKDDNSGYMRAVGQIEGMNYFLNREYEDEGESE